MRNLPEVSNREIFNSVEADKIWEAVVLSMSKYTHDSVHSKFMPSEELLNVIRPVAAAFSLIHFTPFPTIKEIYKSRLYTLFYFTIICGIQIYIQQRSFLKQGAPFEIQTDTYKLREAKNKAMKQLTEGMKIYPPVNLLIDLALSNIASAKRIAHLSIKQTEFDNQKLKKFLPVTLLWGYLFAEFTILDK